MGDALITDGLMRTHTCGDLVAGDVGKRVVLCGWVNKVRDLGGLHFVDLRDKYGLTQLSFAEYGGDLEILKTCSLESTVMAGGVVQARPDSAVNKNMATGEVEVLVDKIKVLGKCDIDTLPFLPHGINEATEDNRLKYRYIDLRSDKLQKNLLLRSGVTTKVRQILTEQGFIEVETPILYKTTPEGARDYLVPSRLHPKQVYSLPQSPQTLKQLLMIGGSDKYFQICRCFRDEDLRYDRQPEFTQIDIEASFITAEYIKKLVEAIVVPVFGLPADFSIQEMTYRDAMRDYGCDKPDLRFALKHHIVTEHFKGSDFKLFSSVAETADGMIKALFLPSSCGSLSRKQIDEMGKVVAPVGGGGVAFCKVAGDSLSGGISKFVSSDLKAHLKSLQEESDGIWLFVSDANSEIVHASADVLRRHLGETFKLAAEGFHFVWVYDFPLLEWNTEEKRYYARHHPFTSPKTSMGDKFLQASEGDLRNVLAEAYDVVCNGHEIGGGSIRIHDRSVQERMFQVLGMGREEQGTRFGFFLDALKYGVPPHGGLAFGLDRIIMILSGTDSIRDVMAFPKTNNASDMMSGAPSTPTPKQVEELHFSWS